MRVPIKTLIIDVRIYLRHEFCVIYEKPVKGKVSTLGQNWIILSDRRPVPVSGNQQTMLE